MHAELSLIFTPDGVTTIVDASLLNYKTGLRHQVEFCVKTASDEEMEDEAISILKDGLERAGMQEVNFDKVGRNRPSLN